MLRCMFSSSLPRLCFNVDGKNICPDVSSSPVEAGRVTAEVNIVEEEQNIGEESRRERNFSWTQDAGVPCCCQHSE